MQHSYTLCLIVYCLFILCGIFIRVVEKSWFTPAVIFTYIWIAVIGFSLATAPRYPFSYTGIGYIALCVLAFFSGSFIWQYFSQKVNDKLPVWKDNEEANKLIKAHVYCSIISGFVALYLLIRSGGVTILDMLSAKTLQDISMNFTMDRYAGVRLSSLTMLFLMVAYSGCLSAGRLFAGEKKVMLRLLYASVLLPILLFTVVYTARAVFLYALMLFLGSMLMHYVLFTGESQAVLKRKNILIVVGGMVAIYVLFFFTQALRFGINHLSYDTFSTLSNHLQVWFSGNVSAFCIWFDDYSLRSTLNWGKFTFAGLSEWLGFNERVPGIYTHAYDLDGQMSFSNIYTLFRFMMDDFGDWGALLAFFILGMLCRSFYIKTLNGNEVAAAVLSGIICWMLFSFVASIFAYNTVLFAWFIFIILIYFTSNNKASADGG